MNKSLLDTDILSEVGKAIDPTVAQHATAYRQAHGFLTLSVISVMEVIQGYHRVGCANAFRRSATALRRRKSSCSTRRPLTWPAISPAIWTASAVPSAAAIR